jgi:sporulation protein YlmC with PRC-barrel domain
MKPHDLERKNVISKEARQLGIVTGIEIDASTWKVTHLRIGLPDSMLQTFELTLEKKPGIKHVEILLPTETIENVTDFIILNKTINELKEIIGRKPQ